MPSFVGVNEFRGNGGADNLLLAGAEGRWSETPRLSEPNEFLNWLTSLFTERTGLSFGVVGLLRSCLGIIARGSMGSGLWNRMTFAGSVFVASSIPSF